MIYGWKYVTKWTKPCPKTNIFTKILAISRPTTPITLGCDSGPWVPPTPSWCDLILLQTSPSEHHMICDWSLTVTLIGQLNQKNVKKTLLLTGYILNWNPRDLGKLYSNLTFFIATNFKSFSNQLIGGGGGRNHSTYIKTIYVLNFSTGNAKY